MLLLSRAVIEVVPGKVVQDQMLSPQRAPVVQSGPMISVLVPKHISGQATTVELPSGEPLTLPDGLKPGSVVEINLQDDMLVSTWSEKRYWSKRQRRWRTRRTAPEFLGEDEEDEDEPVRPRHVRVPDGLVPGDSFHTYAGGKRITVRVPEGAGGGAVMTLPASALSAAVPSKKLRFSLVSQSRQLEDLLVTPDGALHEDLSAAFAQTVAQQVS